MRSKVLFWIPCLALAAGIYACAPKATFQGYQVAGYGLQLSDNEFVPVMYFWFQNGDLDESATKVTQNGYPVRFSLYSDNLVELKQSYPNLEDMDGTYVCTGVSTEGEYGYLQETMKFREAIGELEIENFEYAKGRLSMTVASPVDNAQEYGFFLKWYVNGSTSASWLDCDYIYTATAGSTGSQRVTLDINTDVWNEGTAALVYPAARTVDTNAYHMLMRLGDNPKILRQGATSFD